MRISGGSQKMIQLRKIRNCGTEKRKRMEIQWEKYILYATEKVSGM